MLCPYMSIPIALRSHSHQFWPLTQQSSSAQTKYTSFTVSQRYVVSLQRVQISHDTGLWRWRAPFRMCREPQPRLYDRDTWRCLSLLFAIQHVHGYCSSNAAGQGFHPKLSINKCCATCQTATTGREPPRSGWHQVLRIRV
jgi:hypothetical protein